jgi:hypothetical protein
MTTDLNLALSSTRESIEGIGVSDALVREVLSYRLLVERLGEDDNNEWWESIVLTDTGRARLEEVAPKTSTKAQIDLAIQVGRKAEQSRLEKNTLSLFYLGPTIEAQIKAELEDVADGLEFNQIESLSETIDEVGWTSGLVDGPEFEYEGNKVNFRVDTDALDESDLKSRSTMRQIARSCFKAYGGSTRKSLRVPYIEVEL